VSGPPPAIPAPALDGLRTLLGDRLALGPSQRALHAGDESWLAPVEPAAVAFPETTEEVAGTLRLCARHAVPVTPCGARSGQEGGAIPAAGGLALSLARMTRILAVSTANMDCHVEAGVTRLALAAHLRQGGAMFPVDPGADATLGGMAATGAAGTTTPMYGRMADNVLGLQVVLADGRIVETGARCRKSSAGYDLTRLFVGSEGTLGVITRLRLRLHPEPEAVATLQGFLPEPAACVDLAVTLRQMGLPLARAELCCAQMVRALNLRHGRGMPERPMLLLEFHGAGPAVAAARDAALALLTEAGATGIAEASRTEERSALWAMRHGAAEAETLMRPGAAAIVTDTAVPLDDLAPLIAEALARVARDGLVATLTGHLADGNVHFALLVDRADAAELARAEGFKDWLSRRALALGGTISGEHGIGLGKRHLMAAQHGSALEVMRGIKLALDPAGLLNPGKLLP